MDCQQPFVKRNMGILEDRIYRDRELFAASFALPDASAHVLFGFGFRLQPVSLIHKAAVRAHRTIGPAFLLDLLSGGIFISVLWSEQSFVLQALIVLEENGFVRSIILFFPLDMSVRLI